MNKFIRIGIDVVGVEAETQGRQAGEAPSPGPAAKRGGIAAAVSHGVRTNQHRELQ